MADSAEPPDPGARHIEALPVGKAWRIALGALGIALLVICCYSVLTADNELGTTALAIIGAAVLVISALGQWPARLVWGDKVAEWGARSVQNAVSAGADPQEVGKLAAGVARTPLEQLLAFQLQSNIRTDGRFESEVIKRLGDAASVQDFKIIRGEHHVWDARLTLRSPGSSSDVPLVESVVVLCSRDGRTGGGKTLALAARLQAIGMRDEFPSAVLVVTEYPAERESATFLSESLGPENQIPLFLAQMDSEGFDVSVHRAVGVLRP